MESAENILKEAKTFYTNAKKSHRRINWTDYEAFKQRLLSSGHYGYEGQLANILHL